MRLLGRRRRRNHPVPHSPLPVRNTDVPDSHDNHPHLLAGHEATPATVFPAAAANDALPPQQIGTGVKRVGLEVLGAVEALLVRAGGDEARLAVDGGADGRDGRRVEVEEERGEGRVGGRGGGGPGGEAAGGGAGCWAVGDPCEWGGGLVWGGVGGEDGVRTVVDEEGDAGVGDEVVHLLAGGVGGHDDDGGGGVGG